MRIALDAMGGDHAPGVTIAGAVAAARAHGTAVTLVGRQAVIEAELARHQATGLDLTIIDAPDTIDMDEHAAQAVRRKPASSIAVATRLVKDGHAAAVVSAGNSGAMMAAALFILGRVRGIDRPAIATVFPCTGGQVLLIDVGAIADPDAANMVQFGQMGDAYARTVFGIARPRVGLLSNGEEETKGSKLVQETHALLKAQPSLHFIGNVEGKDVPAGLADVVICDGFAGNVLIKTAEGVATFIRQVLREEVTRSPLDKLLAAGLRPAFRRVGARLDYAEYGGAPLLGVDGLVIIAHGRSNARAVESAIRVAHQAVEHDTVGAIRALSRPLATGGAGAP
ncbi:MAG: phosphate acyltransferase PlsX [Chloroflexi bacterium]|nr:phosphate acyltransferase PlsX [Chloroflexota bacterium]